MGRTGGWVAEVRKERLWGGEGGRKRARKGTGATGDQLGSSDGTGQEVERWQSEDGRTVSGEVDV